MSKLILHGLGIQQLQREIETWLRVIDFLSAENIQLKNRLSEVIQNDISLEALEQIENYQNNFITKDSVLALLAKDILEHKKNVEKEVAADNEIPQKLTAVHGKLRDDVGKIEKEFINLSSGFNKFLMGFLNSNPGKKK